MEQNAQQSKPLEVGTRVGIKHRDGGYTDTGYVSQHLGDDWYEIDSDDPDRSETSYEVHVSRLEVQKNQ